jgi:hypothetical protein
VGIESRTTGLERGALKKKEKEVIGKHTFPFKEQFFSV